MFHLHKHMQMSLTSRQLIEFYFKLVRVDGVITFHSLLCIRVQSTYNEIS